MLSESSFTLLLLLFPAWEIAWEPSSLWELTHGCPDVWSSLVPWVAAISPPAEGQTLLSFPGLSPSWWGRGTLQDLGSSLACI